MTKDQKIQLGLEVLAAEVSDRKGCSINAGMEYVLNNTFYSDITLSFMTKPVRDAINREKDRLNKRAEFIADAVIDKLGKMGLVIYEV